MIGGVVLRELSVEDGEEVYGLLQDIPPEFGFMNEMFGKSREAFRDWLALHAAMARGEQVPSGFVPSSGFWLFVDERPVGYGKMRHHLNEKLLEHGGHIGFAVRRSARGKGYGRLLLRELLAAAAAHGIDRALLTCDEANVRSIRTIEGCGGVLEDVREGRRRYWIGTAPYRREG
jgi:predicted acetyltransferase